MWAKRSTWEMAAVIQQQGTGLISVWAPQMAHTEGLRGNSLFLEALL